MTLLWWIIFLVIFAFALIGAAVGLQFLESQRKREVKQVLSVISTGDAAVARPLEILGEEEAQPGPIGRYLARFALYHDWKARIEGAGLRWSPEVLAGAALLCAIAGGLAGWRFHVLIYPGLSIAAAAALAFLLPFLIVEHKRSTRLADFEQQFPEALDFIARAVRAGHALSVSLELLSSEAPEPVRTEFRHVFHQLNLGAPMDRALNDLVKRVPLVDVRFFVSTILLQRETGGNLAEILIKLAQIIRERFRLKGQVRALSAHGRITAAVLTAVPILLIVGLSIVAPDYLGSMLKDPHGKMLIVGAILGQIAGYLCMRWIVNIKV